MPSSSRFTRPIHDVRACVIERGIRIEGKRFITVEGLKVRDFKNAVLITDSPNDFVRGIQRLVTDSTSSQTLRREGRRLIEGKYSLEAIEVQASRIYRKALESVTLDDKYSLASGRAFMSGVEALVRPPML